MSSELEFANGRVTLTVRAKALELTIWDETETDFMTVAIPREEISGLVSHMQRFLDVTVSESKT